jgi:hypothetical protein
VSRRLNQTFRCRELADLQRQLLFAPPSQRVAQVRRAETLHDDIDPKRNYPFDFIQYRITGRRAASASDTVLVGEAVRPDLRLIIDALSRTVDVLAPDDDPVETTDQLAERLSVSTKTLSRWRQAGLRWRWMARGGKRKTIVFPRLAVERFIREQSGRVTRAGQFTQMDAATRRDLLTRARRIAQARDVSMNQAATHLARKTDRALETVRMLLEKHDREHPDDPIFADRTGPLSSATMRAIGRAHRRGARVRDLCLIHRRTRATIYRAVHVYRLAVLRRVRLDHFTSPTFDRDDADEVILRPVAAKPKLPPQVATDELPPPLNGLYHHARFDPQAMRSLFVRMNYLKHKADAVIRGIDAMHPRATELGIAQQGIRDAGALRRMLIAGNLSLVLTAARRHLIDHPDASINRLLRLLALGNGVLVEQVDAYDPFREQTFESFATYQLSRAFVDQHAQDAESSRALRRIDPHRVMAMIPLGKSRGN